jgi:hypothetical protein
MDIEAMIVPGEGPILTCQAVNCSYNLEEICHAGTISVGDRHPSCDMYTHGSVAMSDLEPCVHKCLVADCFFNTGAACHASGVTIANHESHADCMTVRPIA